MRRSGLSDDYDAESWWPHIMWRGAVASAIRGKRGQEFLKELIASLDAMPEKRLIKDDLIRNGEVCAIGSVGVRRGVDMQSLNPEDYNKIAQVFNLAPAMVREIEFMNDEWSSWNNATPEKRWRRMREWAENKLNKTKKG